MRGLLRRQRKVGSFVPKRLAWVIGTTSDPPYPTTYISPVSAWVCGLAVGPTMRPMYDITALSLQQVLALE
jgi:hypothetical protein